MTEEEKLAFYNRNELVILSTLKTRSNTKSLWRKLFWTTARDSDEYKVGCLEIFKNHFSKLFIELKNK